MNIFQIIFALFNIGVSNEDATLQFVALGLFILTSIVQWLSGRYAVSKQQQATIHNPSVNNQQFNDIIIMPFALFLYGEIWKRILLLFFL